MPKASAATPIFHGRVYPVGISNAARRLGITPNHLRLVLTGERRSDAVLSGYSKLCRELTGKPFRRAA